MTPLPEPTIERLLQLSRVLETYDKALITSTEIEARTGWASHTVRRDISYLTGELSSGAGYLTTALKPAIDQRLGLTKARNCCIIGLGRLGSAYLNFPGFIAEGFKLVAGFDSNVNRVEILASPVPLYPAFKLDDVVKRLAIELALICVPAAQAQAVCDKLIAAGIKGIVNFAPIALSTSTTAIIRNVYIVDELRAINASLTNMESTATTAVIDKQPKENL